jgi:hypothetical protein
LYDITSRRRYFESEISKIEKLNLTINEKHKKTRRLFVSNNLQALGLIFLSPILAIVVWFILAQIGIQERDDTLSGQTGIFLIAAVSFGVGLITEEVVQYIVRFTGERLFGSSTQNSEDAGRQYKKDSKATKNESMNTGSGRLLDRLDRIGNLKEKYNLTDDEVQKLKEDLFK